MAKDDNKKLTGCLFFMLFVLIIVVVILIGHLLWKTAAAWGAGVLLTVSVIGIFHSAFIEKMKSPKMLSEILTINYSSKNVNISSNASINEFLKDIFLFAPYYCCHFDRGKIEKYNSAQTAVFWSIIIGLTAVIYILSKINKNGYLYSVGEPFGMPISGRYVVISCYVVCTILIIIAIRIYNPSKRFTMSVENHIEKVKQEIEFIEKHGKELRRLVDDINGIISSLIFCIPTSTIDYVENVVKFISNYDGNLLINMESLKTVISSNINKAKYHKMRLENVRKSYLEALQIYEEVKYDVSTTGSPVIIDSLGGYLEILQSENLRILIAKRQWNDFHKMIEEVKLRMQELKKSAIEYKNKKYAEQEEHHSVRTKTMTVEKAVEVLCESLEKACNSPLQKIVNFTQDDIYKSSDKEKVQRIKLIYRTLVKKYNVDQRQHLEPHIKELLTEKLKEINDAYEFLRKEFKFK